MSYSNRYVHESGKMKMFETQNTKLFRAKLKVCVVFPDIIVQTKRRISNYFNIRMDVKI